MSALDGARIAYLTPMYFDEASYVGGGERFPLNLAHGVVAASGGGCEVEVVSYGPRSRRLELEPGVSLRVLHQANRPANTLDALSWEMPDALAGADLVHIHQIYARSSEVGLLLAKQQGKPTALMDHGGGSSTLGVALGSLHLADRIFCHSDFAATFIRTPTPVHVLRAGVDSDYFHPSRPERPDGAGDTANSERDHVLYAGRLLPHKGIDRLIAALPAELPLTICGRPYDDEYLAFIRALARGKDVQFVTEANDAELRDLYRRAWATVLPSVYQDCYGRVNLAPELLGLTLLESMACGTPAICSRVGAMPEVVSHGQTGFVFDNLAELTQQLLDLASDRRLVDDMGARARQAAEHEFSRDVAGTKALAVYEDMVETSKKARA